MLKNAVFYKLCLCHRVKSSRIFMKLPSKEGQSNHTKITRGASYNQHKESYRQKKLFSALLEAQIVDKCACSEEIPDYNTFPKHFL